MTLFSEFVLAWTWQHILIGALIFVASFLFNLGIVSLILVKLPADHFSKNRKTKFWAGPNPALHAAKVIGKNLLGVVLVALGVVLSPDRVCSRSCWGSCCSTFPAGIVWNRSC
jgi:hypothetical protein